MGLGLTSGLAAQILTRYDRITATLSEPVETRWRHFESVYFRTKKRLLNRFYPLFENVGGVIVGVGFQQNLSLLTHARPQLCVFFDINPAVTEILVPFVGQLMANAVNRREFITALMSVTANDEDIRNLLEGKRPPGEIYSELVLKTPPAKREQLRRHWKETLEGILNHLPIDARQRSEALRWQSILDNEEFLSGDFFMDSFLPYTMTANTKERQGMMGWLSTEENYKLVRKYWLEGRIVGVTGDIGGPSLAKLADWLRKSKKSVSAIYLSDVGMALTGPGTPAHFLRLYETLGLLPLRPQARMLISHGGALTAYSRTYADALWLYQYLSDVGYDVFFRLNQNVLERVTHAGPGSLLAGFRQEFSKLVQDSARRNEPIDAATVSSYPRLLDKIEGSAGSLKTMDLETFTRWAHNSVPGLDTSGAVFRTTAATLKEAGALRRKSRSL